MRATGRSSVFILAAAVLVGCEIRTVAAQSPENSSAPAGGCEFGVEGSVRGDARALPVFLKAIKDLGATFMICQFTPKRDTMVAGWPAGPHEVDYRDFAAACRQAGLTFFANEEITNYSEEGKFLDANGHDILAHPDGTHRWDITGELLGRLAKLPEFRGVVYDELEHGQMRRDRNTNGGSDSRSTGRVHPYFAATDGMTLEQAYDAVYRSAKAVADNYRCAGVTPMTEDVFPVMLHTFARAGFDPNVKFLKEGIDPVYAAIALGAAKQYGREFCVAPDLWGLPSFLANPPNRLGPSFPGHPPEELRASLLYAYWIGAARITVEDVQGFIKRKGDDGSVWYEPTAYGKVYRWFVKEYVPAHPRPYCFRDVRPEVAIVRLDDSCWGQSASWLPDSLYGAANLKTTPETAAWFGIWNVLTHGQTRPEGLSFHNSGYQGLPHDFFCPLRGAVVYDHLAGAKELNGVKAVFLTGVKISPPTLEAVRAFVRGGGVCVALASLAPAELAGKSGEVADGSGRWVLVEDFCSPEARKAVAPFLGKPDEISYRIGERILSVKRGESGNSIRIYLQSEKDAARDGNPPESARVW
jgi:hypothetical protein